MIDCVFDFPRSLRALVKQSNAFGYPTRLIAAPALQARNDDWNPNKDSNPCHCEATAEAINRLRMFNTFGYPTRLIASLTLAMTSVCHSERA